MGTSSKMSDAAARAKKAASERKGRLEGRLEETAQKAQAAAKEYGAEAQERLAEARAHRPRGNSKRA